MRKQSDIADAARLALVGIVAAAILAGCGSAVVDSGGLTAGDRNAAQAAMNALQHSNISRQLVNLSHAARLPPAACRVHLASRNPSTFQVYVFWIPYIGTAFYTWLDMTITKDVARDKFHLGNAVPVLPGGLLTPNGRTIQRGSADYDTPLALYGSQQAKKNQQVLMAHAGKAFSKPGAKCQVLGSGYLRLVPNP